MGRSNSDMLRSISLASMGMGHWNLFTNLSNFSATTERLRMRKLSYSSFHMDGAAWFQWYNHVNIDLTWKKMTKAMLVHLAQQTMKKSKWDATQVIARNRNCAKLSRPIQARCHLSEGWSDRALMGSFIEGLQDKIEQKILIFNLPHYRRPSS